MVEYIYANFDLSEKDTCTCTVYCDGEVVGGGPMTFRSGIYLYKFEVTKAGSYYAVIKATDKTANKYFKEYSFTIFEEAIPNIVELSETNFKLSQIQSKLGQKEHTIDTLLQELLAYETGVTPVPYMYPVTALNTRFSHSVEDNALIMNNKGVGVTGAKLAFTNNDDGEKSVVYSFEGYWGVFLKHGSYTVEITYNDFVFKDVITV